jgi:acyl carrier protein
MEDRPDNGATGAFRNSAETPARQAALALVAETINEVLREEGRAPADLQPSTNILNDTELDSMGLAMVVVQLEDKTGKDPFAAGFISFSTVGELAALYAE